MKPSAQSPFKVPLNALYMMATFFASCCFAATPSESPRIGAPIAVAGPMVDITLKNGETNQGQLISFADGNLSLKLENGSVVSQEAVAVVSVKFLSQDPRRISAQATELTMTEMDRLNGFRLRDGLLKGLAKEKVPSVPLTVNEKSELQKLRAKVDVHIKALEAEIPDITTEEVAQAKMYELGRYYSFYGYPMQEIRGFMHKAAAGIKNESLRRKMEANSTVLWTNFTERHKNLKAFERYTEKMGGPDKPPGEGRPNPPPGPPNSNGPQEKPPGKPPPVGN
ncbi:MAG: hypothetical protein WCT04_05195 [Planctomycetota bacterium]